MPASRNLLAAAGVAAGVFAAPAHALNMLVPSYFDPSWTTNHWNTLDAAAGSVNLWAILNPESGPGGAVDPGYAAAATSFRSAGGSLLGYVATNYGNRPIAEVKQDVDRYISFYGAGTLNGIIVDQMATSTDQLAYYQQLNSYIHSQNAGYKVFGIPGTHTAEAYLSAADVLVTYEHDSGYADYVPDAWTASYSADRFAHLMINVPDATTMRSYVDLAVSRNVGYVFVTSDVENNPWDTLPGYWDAQVAYVAAVPEPETWALMIAGVPLAGWMARRRRRDVSIPPR